jgi:glycosyltransferase involved in cell wall biosynthesis
MKITILIEQNPFSASSASANRWLTLLEGLSTLGARIQMLIYGGYQSQKESVNWNNEGEKYGLSYKYIAPLLINGYLKRRFYNHIGSALRKFKISKLIFREIENHKGIIWTDASYFSFQLAVKIKLKHPQILLFLEMSEFLDIHKYNKGNFLQRWQANRRQKYFEETAFHAYDGLALMTRTLLKHYEQFVNPKPDLLHLPMTVDLERFRKKVDLLDGFLTPYIAFVGVMSDAKDGVRILIEAFNIIKSEFPDLKLYLIGGWNYDTPIHQQLIKKYGLEKKVFWKGELSRDQIPAIICNAALLALPRPDSKQAQGGFPTKLGEYLATGNPVCVTKVGEIPDYLVDEVSAFMAEPGNVDSFADAMQRALNNKEKAKAVGLNGRMVAEKYFNMDIQSKLLYNYFENIIHTAQK